MKTILESFTAAERSQIQAAADEIVAESRRLMCDAEDGHLRAVVLALAAVAGVSVALSLLAEWIAVF